MCFGVYLFAYVCVCVSMCIYVMCLCVSVCVSVLVCCVCISV